MDGWPDGWTSVGLLLTDGLNAFPTFSTFGFCQLFDIHWWRPVLFFFVRCADGLDVVWSFNGISQYHEQIQPQPQPQPLRKMTFTLHYTAHDCTLSSRSSSSLSDGFAKYYAHKTNIQALAVATGRQPWATQQN